jgi:cytoskeletal protein RodZ
MGSFGENLRREREARGITLDDISKTTKISVRLLQAIEEEDFDRLPGGVFNLNFVRQYARQVGLDEDRVLDEFRALTAEPVEATPDGTAPSPVEYQWEQESQGRVRTWVTPTLLVVCAAAGLYLLLRPRETPAPLPPPPAPPVVKAEPTPEPTAETPPPAAAATPAPAQPPEETQAPVRVELLATSEVWVSASADDKVVLVRTLQAEQKRMVTAQERVRLRVGNAGALKVLLNGQEQPPLGPVGHVRTVVFTPEGMHVVPPPERPPETPAEPAESATNPPR